MCLKIDKNIKPKKVNKDGFCVGWKLINENNSAIIQSDWDYKEGLNVSDRIDYPELVKDENDFKRVDYGFHLFLDKKWAKKLYDYRVNRYGYNSYKCCTKLVKVFYKPKDVVAYGTMNYTGIPEEEINNAPNVVVRQLTIKSLTGVKL